MKIIDKNILSQVYKKRPSDVKKYDYGMLIIIGGSELYSGSPALSAFSAFRSGVDMVRIIAPKRASDIIASFSPDLVSYSLPNSNLDEKDIPILLSMTESAKVTSKGGEAVVVGGGLGRTESTQRAIINYLSQITIPAVIDADAIYAISDNKEIIKGKPFLITPHLHEFFILTGIDVSKMSFEEKVSIVKENAKKLETVILLKGEKDIISDGEEVFINETGSPLMTKGGMGDTLAGIAGAMLARGNSLMVSAAVAAYINGLAGEMASKKYGESVMATDLIDYIFEAIKY